MNDDAISSARKYLEELLSEFPKETCPQIYDAMVFMKDREDEEMASTIVREWKREQKYYEGEFRKGHLEFDDFFWTSALGHESLDALSRYRAWEHFRAVTLKEHSLLLKNSS